MRLEMNVAVIYGESQNAGGPSYGLADVAGRIRALIGS